jgi:hypothetical protein
VTRIWTASDWLPALAAVTREHDAEILHAHGLYAWHCLGYEVAAWPCPDAAAVLDRVLGGVA